LPRLFAIFFQDCACLFLSEDTGSAQRCDFLFQHPSTVFLPPFVLHPPSDPLLFRSGQGPKWKFFLEIFHLFFGRHSLRLFGGVVSFGGWVFFFLVLPFFYFSSLPHALTSRLFLYSTVPNTGRFEGRCFTLSALKQRPLIPQPPLLLANSMTSSPVVPLYGRPTPPLSAQSASTEFFPCPFCPLCLFFFFLPPRIFFLCDLLPVKFNKAHLSLVGVGSLVQTSFFQTVLDFYTNSLAPLFRSVPFHFSIKTFPWVFF